MRVVAILAGGRARRMGGGDKGLLRLGGTSVLDHVLGRLAGQAGCVVLNANGDPARFARFGLPVLADTVPGHPGPLAGVLAGMEWCLAHGVADLVTVPGDTPLLPRDLVDRLFGARDAAGASLACAASGGRVHPVVGLWPARLAPALRDALVGEGLRRVGAWAERFGVARAEFAVEGVDPFFNVNTPEDLAAAERIVALR